MNDTAASNQSSREHAASGGTDALLRGDSGRMVRQLKDRIATGLVSAGGMSVLVAILLIFFYLLYEIVPLFESASIEHRADYQLAQPGGATDRPLFLAMEEQSEIAARVGSDGDVSYFRVADGALIERRALPIPAGVSITSFGLDREQSGLFALGLSDGSALLARHRYQVRYPDGKRQINPELELPLGEAPIALTQEAVQAIAVRESDSGLTLVAASAGELVGKNWSKKESFLTGAVEWADEQLPITNVDIPVKYLLISPDQRLLYAVAERGAYRVVNLHSNELLDGGRLLDTGTVTSLRFLLGGLSLLVGSDQGTVSQWFMVGHRDESRLTRIRDFQATTETPVRLLAVEHRRKGFLMVDASQQLSIHHTTAEVDLLRQSIAEQPVAAIAISPRGDALLVETTDGRLSVWDVANKHPEISWTALWHKVWYESYPEPDYIWQSSAANNDFEPKFSLTPLSFGTLKAAFYAMLVATPLAICGAIYTAYFMAPALRRKVKPLIELMEALPTVILGFLAGLWLAPFVEGHMPGLFALLLLMPVGVLLFGFGWNAVPVQWRRYVPEGWAPVLLIPVIVVVGWGSIAMSGHLERWLFEGDMRAWLTADLGIGFDQRNAVIVGIAMGFAVIPTIFSIAEDAIFSVPKHLSYGSLALGATPWQTLVGVVMPTASPGIFSALMIGMGRAVGETMIVLMATGNTPIMDLNIFEGMRTLSANIAVEIGETEVDSSHYRVLFLAAFVLFMFTFVVNTVAEIVRQRLRNRYGTL